MVQSNAFVWGRGGRQLTPEQIAQQREIEDELARGAIDTSPVGHPLQGLARVANAMAGAFRRGQLDRAQSENDAYNTSNYGNLADRIFGSATTSALPATDVGREMTATAPTPSDQAANWLRYSNADATRSQPISGELQKALSFLPEMGLSLEVFSGGQPGIEEGGERVGTTRHDHGGALDGFLHDAATGRRLDWNDPKDQAIFAEVVKRAKANGVTGFGAGDGYMQPGSMHIGYGDPAVWGAGGEGANAAEWLRNAYASADQPTMTDQTAVADVARNPVMAAELQRYMSDDALRKLLPAGMRNNNPGNIKYTANSAKWAGVTGPSENTDQGDPQAVFATPEAGMQAMYNLALRKYNGGKKSTNQLIAGDMGWTPGNFQAAANVARTMGLSADDDLDLTDPAMASKFVRALIRQEHGAKGDLYPDEMIASAIGGGATAFAPTGQSSDAQQAIASIMPEQGTVLNPIQATAAMQPDAWDGMRSSQQPAGVQVADASGFVPGGTAQGEGMQRRRLEQALKQKAMRGNGMDQQIAQELAVGGNRQHPANKTERDALVQALRAFSDPKANSKTQMLAKLLVEQEMRKQQAAQEEQTWRARQEYTRQQQDQDPLRQMQLEKGRLELDQARNAPGEVKVVGNKLVRVGRDGSVTDITPNDVPASGPFRFSGNSVEAQALNGLLDSGQLTPDQAQQIAAGKTITGPNGEIIFMTPQGITARMPNGQMQNITGGQPADGIDIFAGAPADSGQQQLPVTGTTSGGTNDSGLIQLTDPKNTNAQLPAEMGARIGLGDAFLKELPRIRQQIQSGDASGLIDGAALMMGIGEPANLWRDIETGKEALVRNLTGAGMAQSEAENQAARYQISPTDSAKTMLRKLDNLERDLRATREGAINARSGGMGEAPARDDGNAAALQAARDAIAKGANREAVIKRLRDGGINPEGL